MSLILNKDTGHASFQFHVRLDPTYKSIDKNLVHKWVSKTGLDAKESKVGQVETLSLTPLKRAEVNPPRDGSSNKRRRLSAPKMPEEIDFDVSPDISSDYIIFHQVMRGWNPTKIQRERKG